MASRTSRTLTGIGITGVLVLVLTITTGTLNPRDLLDRLRGGGPSPAQAATSGDNKPAEPVPGFGKTAVPTTAATARAYLAELTVTTEHASRPYDRDRFRHWSAAAAFGWNAPAGCDTREAALIRDGQQVSTGAHCKITGGRWADPYTGTTFAKPRQLDIDHVVPLGEAWRSGADTWSDEQREKYANSPDVVLSVDRAANRAKGDKDPAHWHPANRAYACGYAIKWISIKHTWKLRIDTAEKSALQKALSTCS